MKPLLGMVVLLAAFPAQGQEPAASPKIPIRIGGTFTGGTIELKFDEKTLTLFVVEVGQNQTVYLLTQQKLGDRAVERSKKLTALSQEQKKAFLEGTRDKKGEDLKKALDANLREFEARRKAIDWVVVQGTAVKGGPILSDMRGILVEGEIHDFDATAKPVPPQPGFATVEGEVQPDKVALGKEGVAPFSIKVGKGFIAVAGKQATAFPATKGILRATGPFRIDDTGTAVIEAGMIEALKN